MVSTARVVMQRHSDDPCLYYNIYLFDEIMAVIGRMSDPCVHNVHLTSLTRRPERGQRWEGMGVSVGRSCSQWLFSRLTE